MSKTYRSLIRLGSRPSDGEASEGILPRPFQTCALIAIAPARWLKLGAADTDCIREMERDSEDYPPLGNQEGLNAENGQFPASSTSPCLGSGASIFLSSRCLGRSILLTT